MVKVIKPKEAPMHGTVSGWLLLNETSVYQLAGDFYFCKIVGVTTKKNVECQVLR
jgi:hypothetical protein